MSDIIPSLEFPFKIVYNKEDKKFRNIIEFNPDDFEICTPKKITQTTSRLFKKKTITYVLHRTKDTFDWDILRIKGKTITHKKF